MDEQKKGNEPSSNNTQKQDDSIRIPDASPDMFSAPPSGGNVFEEDFVPETQAPELVLDLDKVKKKKKAPVALFVILGVLVVLIGAVCAAPFLLVKLGDGKMESGEYKTAANLYGMCFGLNGSANRASAARAMLLVQSGEPTSGIDYALQNGIHVDITYDLNGGHFTNSTRHEHVELREEKDFQQFYQATKDYYEFKQWDVIQMVYAPDFDETLIELSLKANFEPQVYTIAYTGLFSDAQENPESYTYESKTITLKNPTRTGYTFVAWTGSGISGQSATVVIPQGSNGDKAFIANWMPNQYAVEFNPDVECEIENPLTVTYDDAYAFPEIEKRGYTYRGWSDGTTTYTTGLWTLTNGISVTPVWELNIYKLSYDLAGGTVAQQNPASYTVLDQEIRLTNPTRFGYTFLGWTSNEHPKAKKDVVIPAGSIGAYDFKANWAGNPHVINMNLDGGTASANRVNVVFGNSYSIPTPTKKGYTFLGWYGTDGKQYSTGNWNQDNDLQVTAKWKANQYTVTFDTAGGSAVATQTATYDQNFTLPSTARKGYEFRGWYYWSTVVSSGPWKIDQNTKLTATWRPKNYTLTLNPDGGTVSQKTVQVTFDKTYTLPTPTKRGYTFKGWVDQYGNQYPKGAWVLDGDLKLTAKWEVNKYTIYLDAEGGSVSNSRITVTFGKSYSLPDAYGKTGYNFAYWYTSGKTIPRSGTYDYDCDLYLFAEWEGKEYTVHLDPEEGEVLKTRVTVVYGDSYKLPTPVVVPEGYEFEGWYDGRTKYKTSSVWSTDGDVWLSAKYKIADYKVTFDANGGSVSPKTKTIQYHASYTLPTPTRTGYYFDGWHYGSMYVDDSGYSWTITKDVTLKAAWIPKQYTIYFDAAGGYLPYYSMTVDYGSKVSSLPTPEREGYVFNYWTDSSGKKYTGGTWSRTSDLTLKAKYTAIQVNITG